MFPPHFLRLFFGIPHSMADTMRLVSALKVEEDLQDKWKAEREQQLQSDVEHIQERGKGRPMPFSD